MIKKYNRNNFIYKFKKKIDKFLKNFKPNNNIRIVNCDFIFLIA